jgi:hypothetical protein
MSLSGIGSLLLAWRVKSILTWVVYSIVAHEQSIEQLIKIIENKPQTGPTVTGTAERLLNIQDKLGLTLLVLGFLSLGMGMLLNAASILCK